MAEFKNEGKAPEGKRINGRIRWVMPGETIELDGAKPVGEKGPEVIEPEPDTEEDPNVNDMDDDELRAYIERETGDKPHWNAKRETLLEKANAL